jgi:monofunctional biosynthetic peptidoglycan transglycosylase
MEVYLNVIEMGEGIYGAEAASQSYFSKGAMEINASQSAAMAAIIPSPLRWRVTGQPPIVAYRQQVILHQMNNLGSSIDYRERTIK